MNRLQCFACGVGGLLIAVNASYVPRVYEKDPAADAGRACVFSKGLHVAGEDREEKKAGAPGGFRIELSLPSSNAARVDLDRLLAQTFALAGLTAAAVGAAGLVGRRARSPGA
jgi:hypothetical protein